MQQIYSNNRCLYSVLWMYGEEKGKRNSGFIESWWESGISVSYLNGDTRDLHTGSHLLLTDVGRGRSGLSFLTGKLTCGLWGSMSLMIRMCTCACILTSSASARKDLHTDQNWKLAEGMKSTQGLYLFARVSKYSAISLSRPIRLILSRLWFQGGIKSISTSFKPFILIKRIVFISKRACLI